MWWKGLYAVLYAATHGATQFDHRCKRQYMYVSLIARVCSDWVLVVIHAWRIHAKRMHCEVRLEHYCMLCYHSHCYHMAVWHHNVLLELFAIHCIMHFMTWCANTEWKQGPILDSSPTSTYFLSNSVKLIFVVQMSLFLELRSNVW